MVRYRLKQIGFSGHNKLHSLWRLCFAYRNSATHTWLMMMKKNDKKCTHEKIMNSKLCEDYKAFKNLMKASNTGGNTYILKRKHCNDKNASKNRWSSFGRRVTKYSRNILDGLELGICNW